MMAKVVLVALGLPVLAQLADPLVRLGRRAIVRDLRTSAPQLGNWLPDDLPASASNIDLASNLDLSTSWFEYDAPIDAVPRTCKPTGQLQFACDRYTLEWSGHWIGYKR